MLRKKVGLACVKGGSDPSSAHSVENNKVLHEKIVVLSDKLDVAFASVDSLCKPHLQSHILININKKLQTSVDQEVIDLLTKQAGIVKWIQERNNILVVFKGIKRFSKEEISKGGFLYCSATDPVGVQYKTLHDTLEALSKFYGGILETEIMLQNGILSMKAYDVMILVKEYNDRL